MRVLCCNVVIYNDVLPVEISDCSDNTDSSHIMATFLKKCYEDKKIKLQFKTYAELLSPYRRPMANYCVKCIIRSYFRIFVYWVFTVTDTCRNRLFYYSFTGIGT